MHCNENGKWLEEKKVGSVGRQQAKRLAYSISVMGKNGWLIVGHQRCANGQKGWHIVGHQPCANEQKDWLIVGHQPCANGQKGWLIVGHQL